MPSGATHHDAPGAPPLPREAAPRWRNAAQLIALAASIVLAAGTVFSVAIGVWNYVRNSEAQVELLARQALQHYLDLAIANPDLASRRDDQPVDAKYAWYSAGALATAQTVWKIAGRRSDWQRAIRVIIRHIRPYLRSGVLVCEDFDPDFVAYLRARVSELKCAAPVE